MNDKCFAYYEPHVSGGFVCEIYTGTTWRSTFRHEGDFDSLYAECERRAKLNGTPLQAVSRGLPKSKVNWGD